MEKDGITMFRNLYGKWYKVVLLVIASSFIIGCIFAFALNLKISFSYFFVHSVLSTSAIWLGCSAIATFSWNKFPWERVPFKHLIWELSLIVAFLSIFILGMGYYNTLSKGTKMMYELKQNATDIIITSLITILITTIHEAIFFYQQWKLNFSKSIRLEKDNLEAQFNTLKAQINPHFLFNSLNSLMSLLDNNPKAEQYVQDLSEFLRYVLISNEREAVTLQEELENLEKYIYLQKMRFGDNLKVEIAIEQEALKLSMPPLVLQMLFDNCIKHNVITNQKPLSIRIFSERNNITIINNLQKKQSTESTGQGLKNIEGRYRFIAGEPIKIVNNESIFSVTIPLFTII